MSPLPRFARRPFRFVLSGAALLLLTATAPTQAQTPTRNGVDYAEYNENTDAAAASFANRVARRSNVAPISAVQGPTSTVRDVQTAPTTQNKPNAPVSTSRPAADATTSRLRPVAAPKSQAARTWEAFLFGAPKRPVSTPKFAFAQRDAAPSPIRPSLSTRSRQPLQSSQALQPLQTARPVQPLPTAQTDDPSTDAEIADARRRRLQELNALLATRRPEEFSRRLALKNSALTESLQDVNAPRYADAPALPILVAEPSAERQNAVLQDRAEFARDDAPFDAARANRSKIRQASNLEPAETLELADDGFATFLLPTRPNALRLSPNVFLSTDLVRLPSAASLREAPETVQSSQSAPPPQSVPASQSTRPLQTVQTPATVATPLPAEPSSDVPTLRPTAQFVEPRSLPTRR